MHIGLLSKLCIECKKWSRHIVFYCGKTVLWRSRVVDPDTDWVEGWTGIYGTNSKGDYVQGYVSTEYIENIS